MTSTRVKENVVMVISAGNVKKAVKSASMSKRFINTMLKVSIINILYHRLHIEEKEFQSKEFKHVCYKTFKSNSRNATIRQFHTYMLACKDAIDKNYLREFYLYFINSNSGDIEENYKFTFNYSEKQDSAPKQLEDMLEETTCELLQTLNDLGKHRKFSPETEVKVEFTYFDDTPEDYEPPGFGSINESESYINKLSKTGNSVQIGRLFTGFHVLKCRARGKIFNFNYSPTSAHGEREELQDYIFSEQQLGIENNNVSNQLNNIFTADMSEDVASNYMDKTKFDETVVSYIDLSDDEDDIALSGNCLCKLPLNLLSRIDVIQCIKCNSSYHSTCQGYLDKTFIEKNFVCVFCRGPGDETSMVNAFDAKSAVPFYRLRLMLGSIYKYQMIPQQLLKYFEDCLKKMDHVQVFLDTEDDNRFSANILVLNHIFKFDYKAPKIAMFQNIQRPVL